MSQKVQLSVLIITYNEANNIKRCLLSLQEVADEIIIVDSFSTDTTEIICKEFASKLTIPLHFEKHAFEGYAAQKNYALSLANFLHVLSLDADEALSPELIKTIQTIKTDWQYAGYYCNRLNNYCGTWIKHGSWYPDRQLRLWNKQYGNWNNAKVHEKVVLKKGNNTGHLKGDLLHYTIHTEDQHLKQIDKFTSLAAAELYQKGKQANGYYLYIKPAFKFVLNYFFKGGFLDGYYGYKVYKNSAYAAYLRYAKLRDITKKK